jgi:uncharacterized protein DUF222/HNH endonuclease
LLNLLAEFDRRRGWADSAPQSCAHWLNWKCGIDMGAAREKVRTALALKSLPRISAAMERGELSYSKVRAITRVADAATEELLLSIAIHGTASGLPSACDAPTPSHVSRKASSRMEPTCSPRASATTSSCTSMRRPLRDGCSGRCEHEHGPSLPAETVRRLGCDASVVAIVEDENGEALNVGRKTRTIPPAIRRALFSRDKDGCRFPGCTNRHYVDGHHIKHWANGGETRLSNLVVLCRFHHRLVHEGGVDVQVLDDGALRFVVKGRSFDSPVPARQAAECRPTNADTTHGNWAQLVAAARPWCSWRFRITSPCCAPCRCRRGSRCSSS